MYTSALDAKRRRVLRFAFGNLAVSAFCGFFAAVYEHFSFGVYSDAMIFSFAPCLVSGLLFVLLALGKKAPDSAVLPLVTASAVTLAVGMIARGVVEIYGTDNRLLHVYPVAAGVILLAALGKAFLPKRRETARS